MDFSGMPLLLIFSAVSVISLEMENFSLQEMLFGQCSSRSQKISVAIGKIVSITLISACSALFATYILKFSGKLVGLLGLIPIGFGVRIFLQKRNAAKLSGQNQPEKRFGVKYMWILGLIIWLGKSLEYFCIYIPFFTTVTNTQYLICGIAIFVLQLMVLILANLAVKIPSLAENMRTVGYFLIPILMISLGVYVLWKNGTVEWIRSIF